MNSYELGTNDDNKDNKPCDFERTDAEETRLFTWAERQTKLTEKTIREQIDVSRESLHDIGTINLKSFVRAMRWKLLKIMTNRELSADSLDEIFEPSDEDLVTLESTKSKKQKKKKSEVIEKGTETKPDHIAHVGEKRVAVFKDNTTESSEEPHDADEDDHPLYKQIPKAKRKKMKQWMEKNFSNLIGYDPRMIAGLTVAEMDKETCLLAVKNESAFLAYTQRRMEKQELPQLDQSEIILPEDLETKIVGVELTQTERKALAFFAAIQVVSSQEMKQKVKPEAVSLASGDHEYDNFECPLCIRSLESKLSGLGVKFDIKCTFGRKHRFNNAQGSRVNWIKVDWSNT